MSILDKKIFSKRNLSKSEKRELKNIKSTGISIQSPPVLENNKKIYFILSNALINFLVVIGTVGSFITPFKIKSYMFVVIVVSMLISLIMAFLYYNNIVKIIGYLLCLVAFIYSAFNFRYIMKGGFGYISNTLMAFFEKELDLPVERSYDVYGYGEKISVTICLIFIVFAVMLLFNMAISESKGFILVFLVSFPITQIPMYFKQEMNIAYFIMYLIGILSLIFMRNSRHYHMEYKKRSGYKKRNRKNKVIFDYTNDGKHSLSFIIVMGMLMIAITLITSIIFPQKNFVANDEYNEWKDGTMDFTKRLIMVGFWGMLSPNGGSAGGVGRNRLGQSRYVQLDYETDLIVTMPIEKDEESFYLKAFNGTFYNDEYWETISEHKDNDISILDYGITPEEAININYEMANLYSYTGIVGKYKKIKVTNVGASPNYIYIPMNNNAVEDIYEKAINDDEVTGKLGINWTETIKYRPFFTINSVDDFRERIYEYYQEEYEYANLDKDEEKIEILDREKKYSEYVKDMYLDVPKINEESIKQFCEKYNLTSDSDNIVEKITNIFNEDYEYTLMPGVTPSNKEFVNYFLDESKKGYCTYFATSTTLILRYLGIPARYAGGYVLFSNDFTSGEITDEEMDDWGDAKSVRFYDGVYEYELNDSQAHAWVEIYVDGYGWITVDTTPSSDEEEEEIVEETRQNGFVDFLTNTVLTRRTYNTMKKTTTNMVNFVIFGFTSGIFIYICIGIFVRKRRLNNNSVEKKYVYLCKASKYYKVIKYDTDTYEIFGKKLAETGLCDAEKIEKLNYYVEKNKYSRSQIDETEAKFVNETIREIVNNIYMRLIWYKKFIFKYIKWL